MTGKFVVFEGIDGAGCEAQTNKLLEYFREKGIPAEKLTYPDYEQPIGKMIHEFLHRKHEFSPLIQMALYGTDMTKDNEKIRAWIEQGKVVITDRYYTSTLAYQSMFGIPMKKILKFSEVMNLVKPDIILYLKIKPETSIERKRGEKQGNMDRNEEDIELHKKVAESYERLIQDQIWSSWYIIDGEKSIEEVFEQVKKVLQINEGDRSPSDE